MRARPVLVIDYGMGNLGSVTRALEECGGSPRISSDPREIKNAPRVVLPGVGAFPDGMRNLKSRGIDDALGEQVLAKQVPFLGICLGMQLLSTRGFEVEETPGLGWIEGDVKRLVPTAEDRRIPHVGWNEVHFAGAGAAAAASAAAQALFNGVPSGKDFYFVHSFHLAPSDPKTVLAHTPYCGGFASAVHKDLIFGVQFHPEKSQKAGLQVLRNFLAV
ncbi:MAG: imidazole glycerol phosphate synthase subunit HisH [Deltaproteobacteria bacterium]|nr:imidazole glycerol phosphate synthase subunit HisH [Deltaproteobacteria bacterium]